MVTGTTCFLMDRNSLSVSFISLSRASFSSLKSRSLVSFVGGRDDGCISLLTDEHRLDSSAAPSSSELERTMTSSAMPLIYPEDEVSDGRSREVRTSVRTAVRTGTNHSSALGDPSSDGDEKERVKVSEGGNRAGIPPRITLPTFSYS